MKAAEFDYIRADSVAAVCDALAAPAPGVEPKIIAGGQTLVPLMAMRLARPTLLIDINEIDALKRIDARDGMLVFGAGTRQRDIERSDLVRERLPLLAKALSFVGHQQTRNRGTIGGSLVHGDPSAEIPLAAVALDASLHAQSKTGERDYQATAFFDGPMFTALAPEECLVEIRFPVWQGDRVGTGFQEVASRKGDFAIVAACAQVALGDDGTCTRIATSLGGVAPTPVRVPGVEEALTGSTLSAAEVEASMARVDEAIEPDSDLHATAAYRGRVARVLLARAIEEARTEAQT